MLGGRNGAQHACSQFRPGGGASGANCVVTSHALKWSETAKQHNTHNTTQHNTQHTTHNTQHNTTQQNTHNLTYKQAPSSWMCKPSPLWWNERYHSRFESSFAFPVLWCFSFLMRSETPLATMYIWSLDFLIGVAVDVFVFLALVSSFFKV